MKASGSARRFIVLLLLNLALMGAGLAYLEEYRPDYRIGVFLLPLTILVNFVVLRATNRDFR